MWQISITLHFKLVRVDKIVKFGLKICFMVSLKITLITIKHLYVDKVYYSLNVILVTYAICCYFK